jgi:uncharacterized GH25 family protein
MAPAGVLVAGKVNRIEIGHGHRFPVSEEAIAAGQVKAFALAPPGKRTELRAAAAGKVVALEYTPDEPGTHTLGFVQDRGILSRTPGGVKKGGKDANPDAVRTFRAVRTAVSYASAGTPAPPGRAAGLEFEIVPGMEGGVVALQVLRKGKPAAGADVQVLLSGREEVKPLGKTGEQGRLVYNREAGAKGPVLFLAGWAEPAPAGAAYGTTNLSTSLYLDW